MTTKAQYFIDNYKVAEGFYKNGDYFSAAYYYEKFIDTEETSGEKYNPYTRNINKKEEDFDYTKYQGAIYKCAESYRKLNYHEKSVRYYRMTLNYPIKDFPLVKFHYATACKYLSKYQESKINFIEFLKQYNAKDNLYLIALRELESLAFIETQLKKSDLNFYKLTPMNLQQKDSGANYGLVSYTKDKYYFTSSRPQNEKIRFVNRIYSSRIKEDSVIEVTEEQILHDPEINQGSIIFTPDKSGMYLTRWKYVNGEKNAAIYFSKRNINGWTNPQPITGLNDFKYNYQQPTLVKYGDMLQLLFSSNRPGGYGGYDIYSVSIEGPTILSEIKNIGTIINTVGDEYAPFFNSATQELIFSSDGRVGMGGQDLYISVLRNSQWSIAENLGYPINSIKDDMYFSADESNKSLRFGGWLSSDRDSPCCLQLFRFSKKIVKRQIQGNVFLCDTKRPAKGAFVKLVEEGSGNTITAPVDFEGRFSIAYQGTRSYKLQFEYEGYFTFSQQIMEIDKDQSQVLQIPEICLSQILLAKPVLLNQVFFDYNSSKLIANSFPQLDSLSMLLNENPKLVIEIEAHTDANGTDEFNLKLSQDRANTIFDYLYSKGVSGKRMIPKGYGESMPIELNILPDGRDNPEGRAKNRRCAFKVISNEVIN